MMSVAQPGLDRDEPSAPPTALIKWAPPSVGKRRTDTRRSKVGESLGKIPLSSPRSVVGMSGVMGPLPTSLAQTAGILPPPLFWPNRTRYLCLFAGPVGLAAPLPMHLAPEIARGSPTSPLVLCLNEVSRRISASGLLGFWAFGLPGFVWAGKLASLAGRVGCQRA